MPLAVLWLSSQNLMLDILAQPSDPPIRYLFMDWYYYKLEGISTQITSRQCQNIKSYQNPFVCAKIRILMLFTVSSPTQNF